MDDLKKQVETGQEDLKTKVDDVQKDITELQEKVDAQKQQDQKP